MSRVLDWSIWGCTIALMLAVTGCGGPAGPPLGTVTGTITLDDAPLVDAEVIFNPVTESGEGGRGSSARTDSNGYYSLDYTYEKKGAVLGEHQVVIYSAEANSESGKDPLLPASYNKKTELRATVNKGSNTANFKLTADGAIPSN